MQHVGQNSALVIARISQLDHALASLVTVVNGYLRGKVGLCAAGRKCSFSGSVGDGMLYFTFNLMTRVRHGLVSVHAGRTLTLQGTRNIILNQGGNDCAGVGILVRGQGIVINVLGQGYAVTSVYEHFSVSQSAFVGFHDHCGRVSGTVGRGRVEQGKRLRGQEM